LLFARCDREKEDWYRRFTAASIGAIVDQEPQFPDMVMVNEDDVVAAIKSAALANQERDSIDSIDDRTTGAESGSNIVPVKSESEPDEGAKSSRSGSVFEGLLLTSCAARGPADYVKFMTRFQVRNQAFFAFWSFLVYFVFVLFFYDFSNRKLVRLSLYQLFAHIQLNHRIREYVFYDFIFYFHFNFVAPMLRLLIVELLSQLFQTFNFHL